MGIAVVKMSPSPHPSNDSGSVFVSYADTLAELIASTGRAPGDLGLARDRGGFYRWNGTYWVDASVATFQKTLAGDNSATTLATVTCPLSDRVYAGILEYATEVVDASHVAQAQCGLAPFLFVNENGTVTGQIATTAGTDTVGQIDVGGGTDTIALSVSVTGLVGSIIATVNYSVTAAAQIIYGHVRMITPVGAAVANG